MAALEARLTWTSEGACHRDRLVVHESACQADGRWLKALGVLGKTGRAKLDASPWLQPAGLAEARLSRSAFRLHAPPLPGRCYPQLAFAGLGQGPRDLRPARVLAAGSDGLRVDPNHPLAGRQVDMEFLPSPLPPAPGTRLAELFNGPGLQIPPADPGAAYLSLEGLARQDEARDALFYAQPRLVHHLDAACRAEIARLHGRFLAPGQRVLDLMASWESHLPDLPAGLHVAGLGMNREELAANPRLAERVVKDLNERSGLPWADGVFDAVLCVASIEYLLRPREVLREAGRVLKPGGLCLVSFSDRWFPDKAVRVWTELHAFERLALVLALLREAGFTRLETETLRGLARPDDDKYRDQRAYADPLFAAWGRRPA